jgi:hypothetical protein
MRGTLGGAPWRIEINTRWWHLGIALTRDDRYCRLKPNGEFETMWISGRMW